MLYNVYVHLHPPPLIGVTNVYQASIMPRENCPTHVYQYDFVQTRGWFISNDLELD